MISTEAINNSKIQDITGKMDELYWCIHAQ